MAASKSPENDTQVLVPVLEPMLTVQSPDKVTPSMPAAAYLASLTTEISQRTIVSSLNKAAMILTDQDDWQLVDWRNMNAAVVAAIMAKATGAPATRNKLLSALKGVARSAFRLKVLSADDYAAIRDVKGDSGSRELAGRDLKKNEVEDLMRVCCNDASPAGARDAAMIAFALLTGARRAEIAMLGMDSLDKLNVDGMRSIKVIGKRNKERELYLHGGAEQAMSAWLEIRGDLEGAVFCAINKAQKIHHDRQMSTAGLDWILKKRMRQAAIAPMSWHDFRRTMTGDLLDAGVDISVAAGILGHSNVQTTARYDRRGKRAKISGSEKLNVPFFD